MFDIHLQSFATGEQYRCCRNIFEHRVANINELDIKFTDDIITGICKTMYLDRYHNWFCMDCGFNTLINKIDYYMVHNKLWDDHVGHRAEGMLCLKCLEGRIKRKLVYSDFTTCPLNKQNPHVQYLRHLDLYNSYVAKTSSKDTLKISVWR